MENIYIKENYKNNRSQIITSKKGILAKKNDSFFLILYNGKIINVDKRNTNIIQFEKSEFNLSRFSTKTTVYPKIQETNSLKLIECIQNFVKTNQGFFEELFRCDKRSINPVIQEMYKRLVVPIHIIILGFIASCLIIKSKNQFASIKFKSFIFFIGFIFILFSEGSSNILSFYDLNKSMLVLTPFILAIAGYLVFTKQNKFKFL